jgi:hypothetical protein
VGVSKHAHPSDYYRFFAPAFEEVFFEGFKDVYVASESYPTAFIVEHPNKHKENCFSKPTGGRPDEILGYGRKP